MKGVVRLEPIYSVKNPRVKEWAALKQKKYRELTGQFMIEGVRLVEEAIASDVDILHVLYSLDRSNERLERLVEVAQEKGYTMVECTEQVLAHIADTQTPQGILAIARKLPPTYDEHTYRNANLVVLVDGIQDPGNLGTIIRTADAVNADAVIVSENTVDPYHPKVIRATMGSLFHLPVYEQPLMETVSSLREQGISIIGSSSHVGDEYYKVNLVGPHALIVGSEANGIRDTLHPFVDKWLRLPMLGKAESLNAAIAASVMMYEVIRQRDMQH
jgi:RNA methyltransferase, TrmH family